MALHPLFMKELTPDLLQKAESELGETPTVKRRALEDLKKLLNSVPNFRPYLDDAFLLKFLRYRKYNVKTTFKTLLSYYGFKKKYSRMYTDFKPSEVREVLAMNSITVSTKRAPNGASVGILRFGSIDTNIASAEQIMAAVYLISESILKECEATQICGTVLVADFKDFSLLQLKHFFSPTVMMAFSKVMKDVLPCRIKSINVINEPFYFHIIYSLMKPFMTKKVRERFHMHGEDMEEFHSYVTPEVLPEELGGKLGPMDSREMQAFVLGLESYFEEINKYGFIKEEEKSKDICD